MAEDVNIKGRVSVDTVASNVSVNELTASIKKTKEALNSAKIGSEEYIAAQKKLIQQQNQLSAATGQQNGQFGQLKKSLQDQVPALAGVTQGTGLFNQALNVLRANPIIGVITVITMLIVALWDRFKKMEAVSDSLGRAWTSFGNLLGKFTNTVLKPLIEGFVALIDAVSAVADRLGESFSDFIEKEMKRGSESVRDLANTLDDLEDAEKRNALALEETNLALKEAREKADDANIPIADRIQYLEDAMAIESKAIKESIENNRIRAQANMQLQAMEMNASDELIAKIREGSYESLKAAREIMSNLADVDKERLYKNDAFLKGMMSSQAELATTTKRTNKAIESLNKEADDKKKADAKEAEQAAKEQRQKAEAAAKQAAQEAKQRAAKAAQEEKQRRENEYQFQLSRAKQQQEIELNNTKDAQLKELLTLQNKYESEQEQFKKALADKKLTQAQFNEVSKNALIINQQQEAAIIAKFNEENLKKEADFNNEVAKLNTEIRLAGITDQREKERAALELSFEDKYIQVEERYKNDEVRLSAIKSVIDLQKRNAEKALQDKYNEEDAIARENLSLRKIGSQMAENEKDFNLQRDLLDQKQAVLESQYLREIAAAQDNANRKAEIEQQHTETLREIANARAIIAYNEAQAKIQALDSVGQTLQNASNLFGKATLASKILGIASATVSTFVSAQKAYESTIGIPIVGPVLAPINAGLAVAAGFKNIKEIAKVQVPGQSGGSTPSLPSTATSPISPQQQGTTLDQQSINAVGNAAQGGVNRAFVLDADIQNNGQLNTRINRAARLG